MSFQEGTFLAAWQTSRAPARRNWSWRIRLEPFGRPDEFNKLRHQPLPFCPFAFREGFVRLESQRMPASKSLDLRLVDVGAGGKTSGIEVMGSVFLKFVAIWLVLKATVNVGRQQQQRGDRVP